MGWATAAGIPVLLDELAKLRERGISKIYGRDYVDPSIKSETDATLDYIYD